MLNQKFAKHINVNKPTIIIYKLSETDFFSNTSNKFVFMAEENSETILIEVQDILLNNLDTQFHTEVNLSKNATVHHAVFYVSPTENLDFRHHLTVQQQKDSSYQLSLFNLGKANQSGDIQIHLNEPNASTKIKVLTLANFNQRKNIQLTVHHHQPNCQSDIMTRGVMAGLSKSEFTGKIIVDTDASKTNAKLENKNLLLSDKADVNSKPELEIYNNDIQCTHGATVGYLELEALFYLKTRGIPEVEAKQLLIQAFIKPIQESLPEAIRKQYDELTVSMQIPLEDLSHECL